MNSQKISRLIEYNTAEFFLNLGYLNEDEVLDTPQIKYIFAKNWQSRVFMGNFDETEASKNILKVISRLKELKIPVLWFISPMSKPKNLQNLLKEHGFTYQNKWKAMAIDLKTIQGKFNIPENLEIKEVNSIKELKTWANVLVKSFEFPLIESYKKYFINAGTKDLNFNYYLGFFSGKPVSTSILFKGKEATGIFYVGTIPEFRKKGIAQAMVNHLLNEAISGDYNISVLQASEMGYPLYKKIGFKEYYVTDIYRWKNPF
ncbi:MAG TPA: GNAT family N-acetyltransferase [Methanobacterium sp.]|nr:GNAT family N-acetyltransferase [Methanobacterium sp.]